MSIEIRDQRSTMDEHRTPDRVFKTGLARPVQKLSYAPNVASAKSYKTLSREEQIEMADRGLEHLQALLDAWDKNELVLDQMQNNACAGFAMAGIFQSLALTVGATPRRVSGCSVYANADGPQHGQDEGSLLSEIVAIGAKIGAATEEVWPPGHPFFNSFKNAEAKNKAKAALGTYKLTSDGHYILENMDEIITAAVIGFAQLVAVHVGDSYTQLDRNGHAGCDRNGPGNHAVHVPGAVYNRVTGGFSFPSPGSWNTRAPGHEERDIDLGEGKKLHLPAGFTIFHEAHFAVTHKNHNFSASNSIEVVYGDTAYKPEKFTDVA